MLPRTPQNRTETLPELTIFCPRHPPSFIPELRYPSILPRWWLSPSNIVARQPTSDDGHSYVVYRKLVTTSLRDEPIAAWLGHQDFRFGGLALDLLAQAVDVRLEGVGGDAGIVAPDLAKQRVAADHLGAGAVEILEDRRLLL